MLGTGDEAIAKFLINNRIPTLSVFARKTAIERAGCFSERPNSEIMEDYRLWLNMLLTGSIFWGIPNRLVYYRIHEGQATTKDHFASEKVFRTLASHVEIPDHHSSLFRKATRNWACRCYSFNTNDRLLGVKTLVELCSPTDLRHHLK